MDFKKENWTKKDIKEFQEYLETFRETDPKKITWGTNLLNTKLPVLMIKTPIIKKIASDVASGNYLSFLDLMIWEYYENTTLNGMLICRIKDFEVMKRYLDIYSELADNWATCDLLSFNIKNNEEKFFNLVLEYIESDKPFKRRIGLGILFNFINKTYINQIFDILDRFENETEYYVNMMNAWLLCECFIKERDLTLKYLDKNKLNKFTINKAISKCRDSYRVTKEDKEMLLSYKK